ncbi:thiamine-phosphate kinase [Sphingomonas sp.]|uniref:thiamine-phosphate kinase n=1 Tax=Sphingomonas sp. TaxID=28214 RepID=UPI0025F1B45F|nr:thiamine-phosphate kinase [Sphingomonas sp.]MBV9527725.1 thiamine-phosphate kinase [Sphingomonas sp.]
MDETEVIARLRRIATDPAARGLSDDAALLDRLVLTHDSIAEGVHFLSGDPPASVGWKLVAVNLSDLAAKGAEPAGALLAMALGPDPAWDSEFLTGVEHACESYRLPLIGGDTIALPAGAIRVLGLTAIGRAGERVPDRASGRPGDRLWLVGTLGDAAAGLGQLLRDQRASGPLVDVYRRPVPLLAAGRAMAPHATAMLDVSDGLLLDARRMAEASGCVAEIDLASLPLSGAFVAEVGQDRQARLFAATGGDDYALLAALPPEIDPSTLCLPSGARIAAIGTLRDGQAHVRLVSDGEPVELPERLGFEHSRNHHRDGPAAALADRA